MGSQKDRFQVFPTPMAKQQMQGKLKIAEQGHKMLKKKAEVLDMRFRKVGKEIIHVKRVMGDIFVEASVLLAEARFVSGDFNQMVLNKSTHARIKVKHRTENVAGVKLNIFECITEGSDFYGLTGLAKGGEKVHALKQAFVNATDILVELATLQTTFILLDEIIKSTNRRVNALEQTYIPKIQKTLYYIQSEMDENARDEFFRMKKIKNLKKKQIEASGAAKTAIRSSKEQVIVIGRGGKDAEDVGNKNAGEIDTGNKDGIEKDTGNKDGIEKGTGNKDGVINDAENKNGEKDSECKDGEKASENKDDGGKDAENKDNSGEKDTENKYGVGNNAENKDNGEINVENRDEGGDEDKNTNQIKIAV